MSDITLEYSQVESQNRIVYRFVKRVMDIILSILGLIVFSPVFLVTAICIKLDSPGPVIFRQVRAGKYGVPFVVYKFRSMIDGADEERLNSKSFKRSKGPIKVKKDDKRITKYGKFIRATTIDELPQIINVLRGEMSIVGPRPFAMYEHERLDDYQQQRVLVKPGLTCFWQVEGRHLVDAKTRIELDIKYTQKQGFLTDIVLFFRTFPALITRRGAF